MGEKWDDKDLHFMLAIAFLLGVLIVGSLAYATITGG